MKRTSTFLTEPQLKALAELSKRTGMKQAEIIRRAIDVLLKNGVNSK
jgi:predicted DNA-binding protein